MKKRPQKSKYEFELEIFNCLIFKKAVEMQVLKKKKPKIFSRKKIFFLVRVLLPVLRDTIIILKILSNF